MKFVCEREKFLNVFQIASSAAASRSPKAILQNVLLIATENQVTLVATDLEFGIRITMPDVQVEVPGRIVLPVGRFNSILRESNDKQILVEGSPSGTVIRGERSEITLAGEDPDEFPEVQEFQEEKYHEISTGLLRELTRRTLFATDTESGRYALGGVLLEFEADKVVAVATDGRRLAKMEGPAQSVGGHELEETTTIVPAKSMQLIERALGQRDGEVLLASRGNDILAKNANITVYSRLVEGRFPKWRDALPKRREAVRVELTAGPLGSAVRQAAVVASEESRGVDFAFAEGSLVLSARTAEVGQSRIELPIAYNGPAITVSLDHRFVTDFLKVLDPEKVITFEVENAEAAALLSTDDGYSYVVMPMARDR